MAKANLEVKFALQDNPLDAASQFLLACLLVREGENDQAIVAFQRAFEAMRVRYEVVLPSAGTR